MKRTYLFYFLAAVFFVSCSDDDSSSSDDTLNDTNYQPLAVGNSWTYQNENQFADGSFNSNQETLTTENEQEQNGRTYYTFSSDVTPEQQGVVTNLLTTGDLSKENNKLYYNGSLNFDFSYLGGEDFSIAIDDLLIVDPNADSGDQLSSVSNSLEQSIDIQGQTVPLNIDYTLANSQIAYLDSYTVDGESFSDVSQVEMVVTIEVTTQFGPVSIAIIEEQEAVTITNYFASEVGLIYSENMTSYEFEDLSTYNIPTPPPVNTTSTQTIISYSLN